MKITFLVKKKEKKMKFFLTKCFFADKKKRGGISAVFPGDIVGLHDTGTFPHWGYFDCGEKLNFKNSSFS